MKKRIEVLEADLKARSVVQPGDEDPNTMKEPIAPFSDWDWTWLQGVPHNHDTPMATKHFIPEIRVDTNYNLDFNHPEDDTISLIEKLDSTETLLMGSDWPHAEGLREPADFWNKVDGLDETTKRAFLRDNGMKLSSGVA